MIHLLLSVNTYFGITNEVVAKTKLSIWTNYLEMLIEEFFRLDFIFRWWFTAAQSNEWTLPAHSSQHHFRLRLARPCNFLLRLAATIAETLKEYCLIDESVSRALTGALVIVFIHWKWIFSSACVEDCIKEQAYATFQWTSHLDTLKMIVFSCKWDVKVEDPGEMKLI